MTYKLTIEASTPEELGQKLKEASRHWPAVGVTHGISGVAIGGGSGGTFIAEPSDPGATGAFARLDKFSSPEDFAEHIRGAIQATKTKQDAPRLRAVWQAT